MHFVILKGRITCACNKVNFCYTIFYLPYVISLLMLSILARTVAMITLSKIYTSGHTVHCLWHAYINACCWVTRAMVANSALNRHSSLPCPELKSKGPKWKNELSTTLYKYNTDIYNE